MHQNAQALNFSYWEQSDWPGRQDFVIIGMGLTGLQTAIAIKEKNPKAKVLVCDRAAWSLGASTRNAGFACFANVSELLDDLGKQAEKEVFELAATRYEGLQKLIGKFGPNLIDFEIKGSREIFIRQNRADFDKACEAIPYINKALYEYTGLQSVFYARPGGELPQMVAAIHNDHEGQLNTAKLYMTIYEYAQHLGIKLLGGMPLLSWIVNHDIELCFDRAPQMRTEKLILCTNAFSSRFSNEDIVPARGQVVVTEVLETLPCTGLHHYDKGYYYWRDIDGRILLGGARNLDIEGETSFEFQGNLGIELELERFLREQVFGKDVKIEHRWSGIMGMGSAGQKKPVIKEIEPNVFLAARLGGMGVALSTIVAENLQKLIA